MEISKIVYLVCGILLVYLSGVVDAYGFVVPHITVPDDSVVTHFISGVFGIISLSLLIAGILLINKSRKEWSVKK